MSLQEAIAIVVVSAKASSELALEEVCPLEHGMIDIMVMSKLSISGDASCVASVVVEIKEGLTRRVGLHCSFFSLAAASNTASRVKSLKKAKTAIPVKSSNVPVQLAR